MKQIKLEDINPNNNLFKTPEGYFDQLPMRVQAKVAASELPQEAFRLSWSWRRTAIWATATCVIVALVWVTYPKKQYSLGEEALSQVSNESIVNYLKESEITHQDLADQIPVEELYKDDDLLLQNLNIDEEALQNALQAEDISEVI